jgi:hypothetical protein
VSLLTVLAARAGVAGPRVRMVRAADERHAFAAVSGPAGVDVVAASGVSAAEPIRSEGPLTVCRVSRQGSVDTCSMSGGAQADADALRQLAATLLHPAATSGAIAASVVEA